MKLALLVPLVLLAACKANPEDYPPGGGPGGSGSSGAIDAATDGNGDAGPQIAGRVCVVNDLRKINVAAECAKNGVTPLRLIVSLDTATTKRTTGTTDDGSFTIAAPQGSGFTWHVVSMGTVGETVFPSAMPFGTDNTIPAIRRSRYEELLGRNATQLSDQQGSIVIRVIHGTNVVASSLDDGDFVLYDDPDDTELWDVNQTGTFGVVWLPLVTLRTPPVPVSVALTQQGVPVPSPMVTVENQTITFVTQDLL